MNIFTELMQTDLFSLLSQLNTALNDGAAFFGIQVLILQIAVMCLAVIVGIFGYKLIKLITAVAAGGIGYYVAVELYFLVCSWFHFDFPIAIAYIPAVIGGVLFFFLSFKKFSYMFYTVMGIVGFVLVYFYTQNILIAIGGGLFLALLSMYMIRLAFVLLTSLVAGTVSVAMLSAILPDVALLKISLDNWIGLAIAGGAAVVFFLIQMLVTRHDRTVSSGTFGKKSSSSGTVRRRRVIREF